MSNEFNYREACGMRPRQVADIPYYYYASTPIRYQPLYYNLLQNRLWLSGFNPAIHGRLLSSNLPANIVTMLTGKIMFGGFKFSGENLQEQIANAWRKKVSLLDASSDLCWNGNAMGYAFVKLNIVDGIPEPDVVFADQAFWKEKYGRVIDFTSSIVKVDGNDGNKGHPALFEVEHRYYNKETGMPMSEKCFVECSTQFDQGTYAMIGDLKYFRYSKKRTVDLLTSNGLTKDEAIEEYESMFPQVLPMRNLGVYKFKSTHSNPAYLKFNIGQSIVQLVGEDNLIKYENANSIEGHEIVTSPKMILVPQTYQNGMVKQHFMTGDNVPNDMLSIYLDNGYSYSQKQLNNTYYSSVPYSDSSGNVVEPKEIAWDIRETAIHLSKISIYRDILQRVGLNADEFEISGTGGTYKAKTSQDGTSEKIEEERQLLDEPLSELINDVLWLYGIDDPNVMVVWNNSLSEDLDKKTSIFTTLTKNFLSSPTLARKRLFPDMSETEFSKETLEIQKGAEMIKDTYYGGKDTSSPNLDGSNLYNDTVKEEAALKGNNNNE